MSMSNVSQTRGNIEKPFIRALFRMPKQLLFLLLHFRLRNHQAIYFFLCQQVHANMYNDLCFTVITILYEIFQYPREMWVIVLYAQIYRELHRRLRIFNIYTNRLFTKLNVSIKIKKCIFPFAYLMRIRLLVYLM